jgi:PAS domain S-box-containing protein
MTETQRLWHGQGSERNPVCGEKLRQDDIIGRPLAFALAGHSRHAILIVEPSGYIRFATTRNLFGWSDEELPGSSLQALIPTLPIRSNTPGYNIAYVRMSFDNQSWKLHRALRVDGKELPVEMSVRIVPIGRSYALLVAIREIPCNQAYVGAQARPSNSQQFSDAMAA